MKIKQSTAKLIEQIDQIQNDRVQLMKKIKHLDYLYLPTYVPLPNQISMAQLNFFTHKNNEGNQLNLFKQRSKSIKGINQLLNAAEAQKKSPSFFNQAPEKLSPQPNQQQSSPQKRQLPSIDKREQIGLG